MTATSSIPIPETVDVAAAPFQTLKVVLLDGAAELQVNIKLAGAADD